MQRKNKYYRRSRISNEIFEKILTAYADDRTAIQTAQLTNVTVRSVNSIYIKLRQRIAHYCESTWESFDIVGTSELRISRTAVERSCKINGRKILVLVLNEYRNLIYLQITEDARKQRKSDSGSSPAGKIISGSPIQEQRSEFWHYLENRLLQFRGIADQTFYLHIKETEFRFNYRGQELIKLKAILENKPL